MRVKRKLRDLLLIVFSAIFAIFFGFVGESFSVAKAEESATDTEIVQIFAPTGEAGEFSTSDFGSWTNTTIVEDYEKSPTGKVIHQTIDNTGYETNETWPNFKIYTPFEGEVSDFAGYIIWIEYEGQVCSLAENNFWGLFNFYVNGATVNYNANTTFISENGVINETKLGGWSYHRNNMTAITVEGWDIAYSYSFSGYWIIPKEAFTDPVAVAPNADGLLNLTHHFKKSIKADIKIGEISYYTDYDKVLNEYGRCNYEFVDHDGEVVKAASVKPNSEVVAPEYSNSFTKNGKIYTFVGWSGYTPGMTITSDLTFTASYKAIDFHMVEGASIRTIVGTSGIRFTAEFDENLYTEVFLDKEKEFGMIITKLDYYQAALQSSEDLITGLDSLGANKYALITESSEHPVKPYKNVELTNTTYRINGVLTNIKYANADCTWIGVGVVITQTEEGVEYMYSTLDVERNARTVAYVASSALNDTTTNYGDTEKGVFKEYVYKTAAKLSGVSEEDYKATQDKTTFISDYSLSLGEGFDTSLKYNQNVAGKETYLTVGDELDLNAEVVNSKGEKLDVACTIAVSNKDVLDVNLDKLTVLKEGYSALTINCDLFGYSESMTVYTGSTDAGNPSERRTLWNTGASGTKYVNGEVDGKPYYFEMYGKSTNSYMYGCFTNISVYYIDYLIEQGYKYLRMPFYFDTTRYADFGVEASAVTAPNFTIWVSSGLVSGARSKVINVPANEWCYYDMDLMHYRMNFTRADGSGIDQYGQRVAATSADHYQYVNMKFNCAYGYVYLGDMTYLKESTIEVSENSKEFAFGEAVDLSEVYTSNEVGYYTVDGAKLDGNEFTVTNKTHNVDIQYNLYTEKIGDGSYTIGQASAWTISSTTASAIEKTFGCKEGLQVVSPALVDVRALTSDVALDTYTGAGQLKDAGFEVTQSYVKRYGDGSSVVSDTIANTERGIFYVSVKAVKGVQTIEYDVTLDIYSSTEAVEYETFGHADSKYAVKAYYIIRDTNSEWSREGQFKSYEYLKNRYVTGTKIDGIDVYGMDLDFDTFFKLNKFGDDSIDTSTANKTYIKNVYSYDINTSTNGYTDEDLSKFTYLALDGNLIQLNTPMKDANGNLRDFNYDASGNLKESPYAIDASIYVYVTPRHTKEYYETFSSSNELKTIYAEPFTSGSVVANFLTGVSGDVSNPTVTITKKQNGSANWQPSLTWAYNSSNVITGDGPQSISVETIATYYDAFANNSFPFYSWGRPAGRGASSLANKLFKLGSLIF